MQNELPYFQIEELYGGNQELFHDMWMREGGCAAVTACDLCIYLDLYRGTDRLYPYDLSHLTKQDYERFAMEMKPFLRPRFSGIDSLDIYIRGFMKYLLSRGCGELTCTGLDGSGPYEEAARALIAQIDRGWPVPCLNLRHRDPAFSDFTWHWFLFNGYKEEDGRLLVKTVSYGEYVWLDFARLWDTGYRRKGGLILLGESGERCRTAGSSPAGVKADTGADAAPHSAGGGAAAGFDEEDEPPYGLTDRYLFEGFSRFASVDSLSFEEREMADLIKKELSALGVEVTEDDSASRTGSSAGNLYAYIKGDIPGPPLLFSAHMDTVSPGRGKHPVWDRAQGVIRSDSATVLGADDAAGIFEILEAVRILTGRELPRRDIELLFTTAEERYGVGASCFDFQRIASREAYVLDSEGSVGAAVVKAPTILSFEAEVTGRASHADFAPEQGVSAITALSRVLAVLPQGRIDPETTCNVGVVSGGEASNIVPARCICRGEIRSYSHDRALACLDSVKKLFAEEIDRFNRELSGAALTPLPQAELCFRSEVHVRAYETDPEASCVKHFSEACEMLGKDPALLPTFGGSDNNVLAEHGIPGLVLACGMRNVHTLSEHIFIRDLRETILLILCLVIQPA